MMTGWLRAWTWRLVRRHPDVVMVMRARETLVHAGEAARREAARVMAQERSRIPQVEALVAEKDAEIQRLIREVGAMERFIERAKVISTPSTPPRPEEP